MPTSTPNRPLKLEALRVLLFEAARWGCRFPVDGTSQSEPVPAKRVAEYLTGAERSLKNVGRWAASEHLAWAEGTGGRYMDYCCAVQGWAEFHARPNGKRPPWRLGAYSELWTQDALKGRRGKVMTRDRVAAGFEFPPPGALAVFHRGAGRGHVERVMVASKDDYLSLGGNEVGRPGCFNVEWRSYNDPQLIGFCDCDPISDDDLYWIALETSAALSWISGIDISRFQDPKLFDWTQIAKDHQFAILRATAGLHVDAALAEHYAGARKAGLRLGFYQWPDQDEAPEPQLELFLKTIQPLMAPEDLVPVLDVEHPRGLNLEFWRSYLPFASSKILPIYGDHYIYLNLPDGVLLGEGPWNQRPLHFAQYTERPVPTLPPGWSQWAIWQRRANASENVAAGRTAGYANGKRDIDLNWAANLVKFEMP